MHRVLITLNFFTLYKIKYNYTNYNFRSNGSVCNNEYCKNVLLYYDEGFKYLCFKLVSDNKLIAIANIVMRAKISRQILNWIMSIAYFVTKGTWEGDETWSLRKN